MQGAGCGVSENDFGGKGDVRNPGHVHAVNTRSNCRRARMSSPPNPILSLGISRGPSARPEDGAVIDGKEPLAGVPFIRAPMLGTVVPELLGSGGLMVVVGGEMCAALEGTWFNKRGLRATNPAAGGTDGGCVRGDALRRSAGPYSWGLR